jgi:hypothetical protein
MRHNQCCGSESKSDRICIILPDPDPYPFQPHTRIYLILHGSGSAAQRMTIHGCGHSAQLSGPAPFIYSRCLPPLLLRD